MVSYHFLVNLTLFSQIFDIEFRFVQDDAIETFVLSLSIFRLTKRNFRFEKEKFQLRNDFIEVTVLNYIHEVISGGREVCSPPCYVHKIFGINFFERVHFVFLFCSF
jgi:hypothetical protein